LGIAQGHLNRKVATNVEAKALTPKILAGPEWGGGSMNALHTLSDVANEIDRLEREWKLV
jgi:hypothetical protein